MAAITLYARSTGNWDKANNWNTAADGSGTAYTDPQDGTDAFTCHANTFTITINKNVTVTKLSTLAEAGTAGGSFTTSGQSGKTITADVYAGSVTCLFLADNTSSELVGNSYGSTTTNSRRGVSVGIGCIQTGNSFGGNGSSRSGTDILGGGVHNGNSSGGSDNTGAYGTNVAAGGVQNGNSIGGTGGPGTFLGGGIQNGDSTGGVGHAGTVVSAGGIHCGNANQSATNAYSGTYVSTNGMAFIDTATGSSASRGYGVESSGAGIVLIKTEVGAYAKSINAATQVTAANVPMVNYGAGGYAYGDSDASKVLTTATGAGTYQPVAVADVRYGTVVGVSPAVGALEIPNSGTPTGTQDATSDACVVSGKKYGSPQRTGSASGGGGIWMPRSRQVGM